MIKAKYHGMVSVSKQVPTEDGQPNKFVKKNRVRYVVSASTQEELEAYIASQEKPAFLDDDPTKPLYYCNEIFSDGWSELRISQKGFAYALNEAEQGLKLEMARADEHTVVVLANLKANEIMDKISRLFPRKAEPMFAPLEPSTPTADPATPPVAITPEGLSAEDLAAGKTQ